MAVKVYKSGRVRLTGEHMLILRHQRWHLDGGLCQECGQPMFWEARFAGDPLAYDLAHIKSRGAGGSDTVENTRSLHHSCHMAEHNGTLRKKGPYSEVSA